MLIAQFVFGLLAILLGLALLGLVISGAAWVVLVLFQRLPLIGRRHRHTRWDELNHSARSDAQRAAEVDSRRSTVDGQQSTVDRRPLRRR